MSTQKEKYLFSKEKPWKKFYTEEQMNAPVPPITLYDFLREHNMPHADVAALDYFGRKCSYGELLRMIDEAAAGFAAAGIKAGDRVSVFMLTTPEFVTAFYALNKLGAVSNLIDPRTNGKRICEQINSTESRILLVLDVFVGKINDILSELKTEKIVIAPLSRSMPTATKLGFKLTKGRKLPKPAADSRFVYWDDFFAGSRGKCGAAAPFVPNRPAAIVYTGGTTGVPKGAVLSNEGINALAVEFDNNGIVYDPGETFLNVMPPFIAYGISCGLHMHLALGVTNILIVSFEPEEFASIVLKTKANHLMGVPNHFERLTEDPKAQQADLSFIHTAATGGDYMAIGSEERVNSFFEAHNCHHRIIRGYGMTELGSCASNSSDMADKPGCVGIPLPLTVFTVRDPDSGEELGPNEQGEFYCTTPAMMLGYYNNPAEEKNLFYFDEEGTRWVKSGDIGYMDEEGFLFVIGRKKRMIVRPDGHNVWPSQIEDVASHFPGVKEVVVVGLKNPQGENGRMPTAFVVPEGEPAEDFLQKLRAYVEEHLPGRDVPFAYHLIDKIPLTAIGKVDYRTLEELPYSEE